MWIIYSTGARDDGQGDDEARPGNEPLLHRQFEAEIEACGIAHRGDACLQRDTQVVRDLHHRQAERLRDANVEIAVGVNQVIVRVDEPRHDYLPTAINVPRVVRNDENIARLDCMNLLIVDHERGVGDGFPPCPVNERAPT